MEPMVLFGGVILGAGAVWTAGDLLKDGGVQQWAQWLAQRYSGFKSRDISSRTACRAGLSPYKIS